MKTIARMLAAGFLMGVLAACGNSPAKQGGTAPVTVHPTRESIQRDFVNSACLRCHTQATAKNRYVDLTDISTLMGTSGGGHHHQRILIKPGCPKQSLFLSIIKEGKMPPTPAETIPGPTLQAVESWIISLKPGASCVDTSEPGGNEPPPSPAD